MRSSKDYAIQKKVFCGNPLSILTKDNLTPSTWAETILYIMKIVYKRNLLNRRLEREVVEYEAEKKMQQLKLWVGKGNFFESWEQTIFFSWKQMES